MPRPAVKRIRQKPPGQGMGNRLGTRWRGQLPIPRHCHPLVQQFFKELNRQQTTLTEVAQRSGQRRGTLSDWRYRREPTLSNFEAALNSLDLELHIVRRNSMVITLEPTREIVTIDGVEMRVWKGVTVDGARCEAFIHGVAFKEEDRQSFSGLTELALPETLVFRTLRAR